MVVFWGVGVNPGRPLDFHGWLLYSQQNLQRKRIVCPHLTRCPCKKPC